MLPRLRRPKGIATVAPEKLHGRGRPDGATQHRVLTGHGAIFGPHGFIRWTFDPVRSVVRSDESVLGNRKTNRHLFEDLHQAGMTPVDVKEHSVSELDAVMTPALPYWVR